MSEGADSQFGKYELLDRIAAGGMAEIFRARYSPAQGVTKSVVIKKILPHYAANRSFIQMFTNEARIAMGLSHGNIAQVFDFGEIDGDYFIAMEFVDGQPLSRVLKRAKALGIPALPPEFAIFITLEALKGLHYAHTRNDESGKPMKIVHRDVSPQNVLVSYEGQIKLVDFGIARARNAGPEETSAGAVKGKYAYFAPEQARAKELDARSDVFAAGIVLYELLTGALPFQGRMMDVLSRLVRGQFPPPREVNPELSEELERVVLKAMAQEKGDRYQSAEAFEHELSRLLAASYPSFTPARLSRFLQLLFEEELVKEGRPVLLPREFVEEAQRWKKAPAIPDEETLPYEAAPTRDDRGRGPGELPPTKPFVQSTSEPGKKRQRPRAGFPWVRAALLFVTSVILGVVGVLVFQKLTRATLEITSAPPGATVMLDGRLLGTRTPVVVGGLEAGRLYKVEVAAAGFKPWSNDVPLKGGQTLLVDARLQALPPPPPPEPKPPEPAPAPPKPAPPPAPTEVSWPVERFELDVAANRIDLSKAQGALQLQLDPRGTYRASLSRGPTFGWGYFVVNDAGAAPGPLGDAPLQIKGASKLFVFRFSGAALGSPKEETRLRQLSVQAPKQKKPTTAAVPLALALEPSARVRLNGLDPSASYELTVKQSEPKARVRPTGAPITTVLMGHPKDGLVVVPVDTPQRIKDASQVWFTILDDASDVQEGRLTIEVRVLREPKKTRKHHR